MTDYLNPDFEGFLKEIQFESLLDLKKDLTKYPDDEVFLAMVEKEIKDRLHAGRSKSLPHI